MAASPETGFENGGEMTSTRASAIEVLEQVLDAFNRHDLDAIMACFAEDAVLELPRGAEPWGTRHAGKAAVREGLAGRFAGIPDVHYSEDRHWACGDRGASEWLLTGTTTADERIAVRGCDLWEFRDGLITRKDSYWKIVDPAT
jgi:ketosteroid isomerase-like protein